MLTDKDKETKAHKHDETMCHTLKDRVPSALLQGTRLFLLLFRSIKYFLHLLVYL